MNQKNIIVTLAGIIVVLIGGIGYIATRKTAPESTVFLSDIKTLEDATKKENPESAVMNENIIYKNDEFNFELTLSEEWKAYKINELGNKNVKNIGFHLPTTDPNYISPNVTDIPGYAPVFVLNIFSESEWKNLLSECQKEWTVGCVTNEDILAMNDQYYIFATYANGGPSDFFAGKGTGNLNIDAQYLKNNLSFTLK